MRKRLRWLGIRLMWLLFILLAILLVNTFTFSSRQIQVAPLAEHPKPLSGYEERLSRAIQCPTVYRDLPADSSAFVALNRLFQTNYPLVDSLLYRQPFNQYAYLYHWPGKNPRLKPILLLGHTDVVPAPAIAQWTHPPFSGHIDQQFIWGRGAMDDKMSCLAILETIELLLQQGYQPSRSLYIAFGHDEEDSGLSGAGTIAKYLSNQGLSFTYILDEGLTILEDPLAALSSPLAMIGTAEKGYVTFSVSVNLERGGHASMPPRDNAIALLNKALHRIQADPLPARSEGTPVEGFFDHVGPEMRYPEKILFANRWLFQGFLHTSFSKDPAANALVRTTVAPTMLRAGFRENVLPTRASAKLNVRILPGSSIREIQQKIREIIDDPRVLVRISNPEFISEPSAVSPSDSYGYRTLERTIKEVFPEVLVAPNLLVGASDARYYTDLSEQVYRFTPLRMQKADLARLHGIDERISIEGYTEMIQFYHRLILNSTR